MFKVATGRLFRFTPSVAVRVPAAITIIILEVIVAGPA
jgi:hypothetical protein